MTFDRMSDAELIAAVRRGDATAYGVLYQRHLDAAKRVAACLVSTPAEREDLVADAFTKILRALRGGGGPNEEFRAYLLVTMRNGAISTSRRAAVSLYADVPETYLPRPGGDPVLTWFDTSAAASAFASLPERWRMVLWHTEVEDETPAEIAKLLGMRPNGVAALAYRAREGLRQAYLREHLREVEGRDCRATVSKLAGFVRRSVPVQLGRKISSHLATCADCRARAATLSKVNEEIRGTIGPLLLGLPLAAAYLPAGGAVAKSVLAKVGAVALVAAATAAVTVASNPPAAIHDSAVVPSLTDVVVTTATINGRPAAPAPVPVPVSTGVTAPDTVPTTAPPAPPPTTAQGTPPAVPPGYSVAEQARQNRDTRGRSGTAPGMERRPDRAADQAEHDTGKAAEPPGRGRP